MKKLLLQTALLLCLTTISACKNDTQENSSVDETMRVKPVEGKGREPETPLAQAPDDTIAQNKTKSSNPQGNVKPYTTATPGVPNTSPEQDNKGTVEKPN